MIYRYIHIYGMMTPLVILLCSLHPFRWEIHRHKLPQRCQAPWPPGQPGRDRWCMEVWGRRNGFDPSWPRKFGHAAWRESGGHGGIHESFFMVKVMPQKRLGRSLHRKCRWWHGNRPGMKPPLCRQTRHFCATHIHILLSSMILHDTGEVAMVWHLPKRHALLCSRDHQPQDTNKNLCFNVSLYHLYQSSHRGYANVPKFQKLHARLNPCILVDKLPCRTVPCCLAEWLWLSSFHGRSWGGTDRNGLDI